MLAQPSSPMESSQGVSVGAAVAPKVFECVGVNDMIGGLMEAVPANTHIIVVGVCMLVDKFRPTTAVVKEREHAHSRLQSSPR